MMCADMLEVVWRDEGGKRRRTMALLEDISPSGACVQLETPLPAGVAVEWSAQGEDFQGIVRYCNYREIGYFAGVEFSPATRWSKTGYQPQHLFDPRRLTQ